jgi:hypothetical protein
LPRDPSWSEALSKVSRRIKGLYIGEILGPPKLKPAVPPPVDYLIFLIQYIRSFLPYMEAVSSNLNQRMHHIIMTREPLKMGLRDSAFPPTV